MCGSVCCAALWALLVVAGGPGAARADRGAWSGAPLSVDSASMVPPAIPNLLDDALARALPAVVKLYGASTGAIKAYGTGVLVSADGLIVTIDSVLLDAANLRAVLADGRTFRAEVQRRDAQRELALLKIEANRLPFLAPAPSTDLRLGDDVIALGNCFKIAEGEEPVSVMFGILASRGRLELRRRAQPFEYGGELLVVDAITSNPGMSGGPLLDGQGRWIGLIGPVADSAATNTRLNYAMPTEALSSLLSPGSPRTVTQPAATDAGAPTAATSGASRPRPGAKAYLGVRLFKLGYHRVAAYVDKVDAGSPAEAAGIRADDLIIAIDDRRIGTIDDYERAMSQCRAGQTIRLTLKRGQEVLTLDVALGEAPR